MWRQRLTGRVVMPDGSVWKVAIIGIGGGAEEAEVAELAKRTGQEEAEIANAERGGDPANDQLNVLILSTDVYLNDAGR